MKCIAFKMSSLLLLRDRNLRLPIAERNSILSADLQASINLKLS